ncbi:MAG: hypothetical protein WAM39_02830 [Bryobacteraceae bacterium]
MTRAEIRTDAGEDLADHGQEFYTWSVPGAPVRVHVSLDVVRGIEDYLGHEPPSLSGAISKSGLLLGRIDVPRETRITGFQLLSITRPVEVEGALAGLKNSSDDLRVVGFFRTHDKDRLCLGPSDLSLAEALFQNPGCVFLLISPSETGPSNAGFFFWDVSGINGDFCFLEFPFDARVLPVSDRSAAVKEGAEAATSTNSAVAPIEDHSCSSHLVVDPLHFRRADTISPNLSIHGREPRKIAATESPTSLTLSSPCVLPDRRGVPDTRAPLNIAKALWGLIRTLLAFALGAGIALVYSGSGISGLSALAAHGLGAKPESLSLGLRVENQGAWLRISWDRAAPGVQSATQGLLEIKDGSKRREAQLDLHQLADGSVLYRPESGDVALLLKLRGKRGSVSESLRVLAGDRLSSPGSISPKTQSSSPSLPFHQAEHSKSAG